MYAAVHLRPGTEGVKPDDLIALCCESLGGGGALFREGPTSDRGP